MVDSKTLNKILKFTKRIPKGRVASYKEIGMKLKIHPRAVARALASNPHPIKIPCHRIVHDSGKIGGYTPSGKARKMQLLRREGVNISKGKINRKYFYYF